ncbi:uncharacterized protein LOC120076247 [Benincasa hispida]|uniref:uncharacterized protein LOC120076247 n=1 Tax=Benincasa hispida TaxID=102211 RepID=UPI0018FFBC3F|nr:uncharacterized protein LOC120076247 [Benincasa hispida]
MSSLVQLLASDNLIGDNYATWKSNLSIILVIDDPRYVLTEKCPPVPSSNANKNVRDAYDRWIKTNEKAHTYILANISNVLAKKHESMSTTKEIMESLHGMFGQPFFSLRRDAIKYVYNCCMKAVVFVREYVLDMMVHFNVAEVYGVVVDEKSQLGISEARPTIVTLQLSEKSIRYPEGKIEDILVQVETFINSVNFIILEANTDIPIILGRPFLSTGRALIDLQKSELTIRVDDQQVKIDVFNALNFLDELETCQRIDDLEASCWKMFDEELREE